MDSGANDRDGLVVIHDQADIFGGSERVVEAILRRFPTARVIAPSFAGERGSGPAPPWACHARLLRFQGSRRHFLAPLYARRVAAEPLDGARLVLSVAGAGWSLAAHVPPGARHVCYSAGLPRQLFGDADSYLRDYPRFAQPLIRGALPFLRAHFRQLIRRPDRALVNSAWSARELVARSGVVAEVLPPPVGTSFFTPSHNGRRRHVLVVARAVPHKRLDVVLESFRHLNQPLVVAGTGPWLERFRASAPPNVHFTGYVPDAELRELYRSALVLVHPSIEEFGIVMAEAQACGTPVIAPKAGGALEIVRDGETGILLDRVDPRSIATAVDEVSRSGFLPAACRAAALRFAEERFIARFGTVIDEELALTATTQLRPERPRSARPDLSQAPLAPP